MFLLPPPPVSYVRGGDGKEKNKLEWRERPEKIEISENHGDSD